MSDDQKHADDQRGDDTGDKALTGQAGKGAETDRAEADRKAAVERGDPGSDTGGAAQGTLHGGMPSSLANLESNQGENSGLASAGEQRRVGPGGGNRAAPAPRLSFEGLPPAPIGGIEAYFEARETRIVQWVHDLLAHHGIGGQPQPLPNPTPAKEA